MSICNCKICQNDYGEEVNEMILNGSSPVTVIQELNQLQINVTEDELKQHLENYGIKLEESKTLDNISQTVDLNSLDFSEYLFEENNPISVIGYLQKINLKIYLNQTKITLIEQDKYLSGLTDEIDSNTFKNLAVAFKILADSTGMNVMINQQEAIKAVESMGLEVKSKSIYSELKNVSSNSQSETD